MKKAGASRRLFLPAIGQRSATLGRSHFALRLFDFLAAVGVVDEIGFALVVETPNPLAAFQRRQALPHAATGFLAPAVGIDLATNRIHQPFIR